MAPARPFTAIVLAGDRAPGDPLVRAAGACCKALIPVAGEPMLLRVLRALGDSACVGTRVLCGPSRQAVEQVPELRAGIDRGDWSWLANRSTPSTSAAFAMRSVGASQPVLLTTADHALLSGEIVDYFCSRTDVTRYDLVVALAPYHQVVAAHPGVARTGLRFRDGTYCSCNLFAFVTAKARAAAAFWRQVEQQRKRPWRMIRVLGWISVVRYRLGLLTLEQTLALLSQRLRIRIGYILLPFPEAAVDVDRVSDWEYVQQLLGTATGVPKPDLDARS